MPSAWIFASPVTFPTPSCTLPPRFLAAPNARSSFMECLSLLVGVTRWRRLFGPSMAHQPDKDSDADGHSERDERPMLDLAGQPPQCLVSEPCRVAAEIGGFLAEGVGAAA